MRHYARFAFSEKHQTTSFEKSSRTSKLVRPIPSLLSGTEEHQPEHVEKQDGKAIKSVRADGPSSACRASAGVSTFWGCRHVAMATSVFLG